MSILAPEPENNTDSPVRRKAISRRLRYEILRRDNHTCYYCHRADVPLTIDHVLPVALGGTDDPSNLCAACVECNGGKSSSSPDASTVAQVSDDAARWAAAMQLAAERLNASKTAASERTKPFYDAWFLFSGPGWSYRLPGNADEVLIGFLAAGLPAEVLADAARIALRKRDVDNYWHYFQGVVRNMLADLQRDAAALLSAPTEPEQEQEPELGWGNRPWRKGYMTGLAHQGRAESGDPLYRVSALTSVYQYGALSMVVDANAMGWMAEA